MRPQRERAQSTLEYVILFGVLTVMAGVTLIAVFSGGGQFQDALEGWLKGG